MCFISVSQHSKTIKALGRWPRAFISFLVLRNPDETLALVYEILHHTNILSATEPLLHDKKHLNRIGVSIFARGLTRAVYKGVIDTANQVPSRPSSRTYGSRDRSNKEQNRYHYHTPRPNRRSDYAQFSHGGYTPAPLHRPNLSYSEAVKQPPAMPVMQPELFQAFHNVLQNFFTNLRAP